MARTIPAQARLRSSVPSIRVLHAINPFVAAILRSPLHGLLSRHVILLTHTGRTTGMVCMVFPVGEDADRRRAHPWRRNLRRSRALRGDTLERHGLGVAG